MSNENIVKFLQTAYTDEKLAALLAHAQDGKLAYNSCCCFIGMSNSNHGAYLGDTEMDDSLHQRDARALPFAEAAEREYAELCYPSDHEGRERIIPLILAEMERRELLRTLPDLPLSEQLRLEEEDAAEEGAAIEASNLPYPEYERNGR